MNQEKIIQAISAYLEKETIVTGAPGCKEIQFGGVLNQGHFTHAGFCKEVAEELAAAIAPHLEAGEGVNVKVIVDLREKIGKVTRSIQRDRESTALEYCKKIDDILRLL